ncbi:MAG: hypothetical protein Q7U38_18495 [Methylobacter sp.]|nr:hypothetical protein [Methylobacter sp.]MDP2098917.1 hypothetical protein [Methylobacter sp.]MDP2426542.1 hypothetical protein [Methylobacter sp.]MDP3053105.1 hypothetical protein [Methylobacter sp.]MDP3361363.1 hypothetical protein [Methylobacter sp.]
MNNQVVAALSRLVARGYVTDGEQTLTEILSGIAHPAASGWVLSNRLLAQRPALSDDQELVLALLGLLPEVRKLWLSIMAARCQEAGQMPDSGVLVQLITQLQGAAAWVESALPDAELAATPHAAIERALLGVSLEQASATPRLARILAASFALQSGRNSTLPAMPLIDASGMQANENWTRGRLLALPGVSVDGAYVLANSIGTPDTTTTVNWVFSQPWALLLAMLTYAQYNWAAEGRGGLLLELSPGQNAVQPSHISVLVQDTEGDERQCGSLAELILRVLDHLGMHCFPERPPPGSLDTALASLIGPLLVKTVWRYQDGASGQSGQYLIHPDFADACFRLPGSKVFNRTGRFLWQTIRIVAEQWRRE